MARGGVRGASGGAGAAGEEARGEVLRGAGAEISAALGGDAGDARACDERGTGAGILGDAGGEGHAGGASGGERGGARVGGVLEEDIRGGPGEVREVRRGDEAGGGNPG